MRTCLDCGGRGQTPGLCLPCRNRLYAAGLRRARKMGWPTVLRFPTGDAVGVAGRSSCEECGRPPLGGGRWCLPCFQQRCAA